ncbi:MAG: hypothetical protein HY890_06260 [Deltaproteobacteria bacterium]|nr:hypothetical protein [Deltaproteobacteria bacterium]
MEILCKCLSLKRLQVWLLGVTIITLVAALMPGLSLAEQAAGQQGAAQAVVPPGAAPEEAAAQPEIAGSGNYKAGEDLYTGRVRLKNGGPPCISCHTAGNPGTFGGGTLGPNLTKVWEQKFFLIDANWINSEGVPVMGAIFSRKNITPEEVEDLKAFFSVAARQEYNPGTSRFVSGGVIGTIALLIFFSIVWGNRYRKRCQGTAHEALWRNYGGKGGRS